MPQAEGGGAESCCPSPGTDGAWPLSVSPSLFPDASRAPGCSHTRLPATLNVLGIFMPPCFCTHRYCFLECSHSTSNCPTLTHPPRSTHLYYPFSMKSTPQLYPTLEPFHGSEGLPVSGWEFSNFVCLESRGIMRMFRTEK